MSVIAFAGVSKSYPVYSSPRQRLQELLFFNRRKYHRDFWALRDLSFEVRPGETFCIIGENGSGKSTLLQLVAGILQPTTGTVTTNGRISALLELGSGFNLEFSGRENVFLSGSVLGFSRNDIRRKLDRILDFAEIGDFVDQPVKTYSTGMLVRLAFSVAIHTDPDILLVDEALAVGDVYFRQRCMRKIHELRARGVTILFVSHATADVKALGSRALWLEAGRVVDIGPADRVVSKYLAAMTQKDGQFVRRTAGERRSPRRAPEITTSLPNIDHRWGTGAAKVLGIEILTEAGERVGALEPRSVAIVRISVEAKEHVASPIVGFMMRNHLGVDFAGTNTARENAELPPMVPGDVITVDFHLNIPDLYATTFSFSPAIADGTLDQYATCDWVDNAIALQMAPGGAPIYGTIHLDCSVSVNAAFGAAAAVTQ